MIAFLAAPRRKGASVLSTTFRKLLHILARAVGIGVLTLMFVEMIVRSALDDSSERGRILRFPRLKEVQ